jgi:hypothetical protein
MLTPGITRIVATTVLVARTRPALASPAGTDADVTGS